MRPLIEARSDVLASLRLLGSEQIPLADALHRVVTHDVVSMVAIPPFANSAMDGYAIRSADLADPPAVLEVIEDVPAGSVPSKPVGQGQATRIMTGAPIPEGADAIAMVEITSLADDGRVRIEEAVSSGTSVRPAGSDVEPGDVIVRAGTRLSAPHLASIASVTGMVEVSRRPRVAIMSTGDEVVPPDTVTLGPGKIRDTNRPMLAAMLSDMGMPVLDLGIVGDDVDALSRAFGVAAAEADIIVSTGGVSMGDYDHVKHVLGDRGTVEFWRVAMPHAKPFAFGRIEGVPFFGLPGNPVSTFVAFEQFVRPSLLHMMGARSLLRRRVVGTMGEDVATSPDKEVYLRVMLVDDHGRQVAVLSGGQGSNVLSALAAADAFAVIPVGTGQVSAGDDVILELFRSPEGRTADE
jgi:molybdopterin molybdotransferase